MQRDSRRRKSSVAADDARIAHHTFDLFVEFVAVGDDEDAGLGIVFEEPLGDEHHEDALTAALGVPDDAALALGDAFLRGLYAVELMQAGHLFSASVEDDEVTDEIEQAGLFAHLCQRSVEQGSGREFFGRGVVGSLPLDVELFFGRGRAEAQALSVATGKKELGRDEESLVENRLLVGDELAHAIGEGDGAAFEFDHADGETVQVNDQIGPALMATA